MTEQTTLDDFVSMAALSNKVFEAEKHVSLVVEKSVGAPNAELSMINTFLTGARKAALAPDYVPLKLPRRPAWTREMSAI